MLNINFNEILNEVEEKDLVEKDSKYINEPGVYEVVIADAYIDTTRTGASFISFKFLVDGGERELNIENFDVERMISNKDGNTRMSNNRLFNGIILLRKITDILGVEDVKQTKGYVKIFSEQKEVIKLEGLKNRKLVVGVYKFISEYEGKEYEKLRIKGVCKIGDNECIEKLKKKIESKPVVYEQKKEAKNNSTETAKPQRDDLEW